MCRNFDFFPVSRKFLPIRNIMLYSVNINNNIYQLLAIEDQNSARFATSPNFSDRKKLTILSLTKEICKPAMFGHLAGSFCKVWPFS